MKILAYWSKQNPVKARLMIAMCHVIWILLGIVFGIITYAVDFHISSAFLTIMVIVFSLAYLLYPRRGETKGIYKYTWSRRVKHDITLVLSSACMLAAGVNQLAYEPLDRQGTEPQVRLMATVIGSHTEIQTKKEIRKELITQIKAYKAEIKTQLKSLKADWKENGNDQVGPKIVLILLILVIAGAAAYGIGVAACNLSCSGQEGLAVLVAVGGGLAILFLTILGIRAVVRMNKRNTT